MEELEFEGVIYDFEHPEAPKEGTWYHLTPNDVLSMPSLVGLPVRVEHEEDIDVGEIVSCSVVNGKARVRGRLRDGPRGWAAKQLMKTRDIKELSLRHAEFVRASDGKTVHRVPIEVSLVAKGARPGSIISASKTASPYLLILARSIKAGVSSTASVMETNTTPAAATPAAPAAAAPATTGGEAMAATNAALSAGMAAAAPTPVSAEEPNAKRARSEDDNGHVKFAQAIAAKVTDADTLQAILGYVAQNMELSVDAETQKAKFNEERAALQQKEAILKESNKAQVMEAVNVINNLYKHFVPNANVTDSARESFTDLLVSNAALKPEIMEFLRPMTVAASALTLERQNAAQAAKEKELKDAMDKIQALSGRLNAARNLGAVPAVQPNWQQASIPSALPAAVPEPARAAQQWQAAAPMVDVAASGAAAVGAMTGRKPLPPALEGLLPFGETRMKVLPNDFSGAVPAMRQNGGSMA